MEQLLPLHIHRGKINDLTEYSNDPKNNNSRFYGANQRNHDKIIYAIIILKYHFTEIE